MLTFKQWLNAEYGGHTFVFFKNDDMRARANAHYLVEAGRTWQIDKKWSVRMDRPHAPNMDTHNHIMFNGNDVSIINRDGTQSHGTTREQVPNWLIDRIKQRGWITESLLVETSGEEIAIPRHLIDSVHRRARWHDLLAPITGLF